MTPLDSGKKVGNLVVYPLPNKGVASARKHKRRKQTQTES